jgi:membrane protease YdiL (CAAX protease family)
LTDSTDFSATGQPDSSTNPLSPPELPPQTPFTFSKIFFGKDGLRAGWSLLIFFVLMFAALRGVNAIAKLIHLFPPKGAPQDLSPTVGIISEGMPLLAVLLITWIMSKIENRPRGIYGLGGQRRLPQFFAGLAWGFVGLSLLILILKLGGYLAFDGRLLFGADVFKYGAFWLLGFLAVGLLEEYLTRGYVLFTLTRGFAGIYFWIFKTPHSKALGFWTGAFLLSVLFGLGHGNNPGESPIGLLSAGLASLVFCLSLWRTGSLWWAIGLHTSWDWAQSFLYGVADSGLMVKYHLYATHTLGQRPLMSGGLTGPEGSVFVLPVLALVTVIIIFTLPSTGYPDPQPSQSPSA